MECPPILVINLDHRVDRWEQIQNEFKDWSVPLERVSAVKYNPGWIGCYLSHIKCVKIAKERNYPWVLIVEDDCILEPDTKERFTTILPFLWNTRTHWDLFMGGMACVDGCSLIDSKYKIVQARGYDTHFYLIHNDKYNRILDIMDRNPIDITDPCDKYYRTFMRQWTIHPFLARQHIGISDITGDVKRGSEDAYTRAELVIGVIAYNTDDKQLIKHTRPLTYNDLFYDSPTIQFPPILVINLDHRTDKWEQIQHDFADWSVPLERVSAIKHDPGWKGCYLSHIKCVKIAKERNYPWVLYLEDDCMLKPDAKERFKELLPFLWNNRTHWDFFMGGLACLIGGAVVSKENRIVMAQGFGAHFCLIHRDTYDRILDLMDKSVEELDEPCDWYFRNYMRMWTTVPFIAQQQSGMSDISNVYKDSLDLYAEAEQALSNIL
jgi:Glycosyltransferase family 25 (LPS biosynthesis protein)